MQREAYVANLIFLEGSKELTGGIEGIDRLDQPDRTDGNEVVRVCPRIIKLARNVHHQAQIVFDKGGAHSCIPLRQLAQQGRFFLRRIRERQRLAPADIIEHVFAQVQPLCQPPQRLFESFQHPSPPET